MRLCSATACSWSRHTRAYTEAGSQTHRHQEVQQDNVIALQHAAGIDGLKESNERGQQRRKY